jgi:hypothetical protein
MPRLPGISQKEACPGAAEGGGDVQLRLLKVQHWLARGLLQLGEGLVGGGQELAVTGLGLLWHRQPQNTAMAYPPERCPVGNVRVGPPPTGQAANLE